MCCSALPCVMNDGMCNEWCIMISRGVAMLCSALPCVLNETVCNEWSIVVSRLHFCDVTHSHAWHDAFICAICLIHVCDMTHLTKKSESWLMWMSLTHWVVSHPWMRHAAHMNESCHTHVWGMSHIWMSHVTRIKESSTESCVLGCSAIMSKVWMSDLTHLQVWQVDKVTATLCHRHICEGYHTHECVTSYKRTWMSYVKQMSESFTRMNKLHHTQKV